MPLTVALTVALTVDWLLHCLSTGCWTACRLTVDRLLDCLLYYLLTGRCTACGLVVALTLSTSHRTGLLGLQGLSVVAPAPAAMQGLWVVATNNKEDVVLTRVPWAALLADLED